MVVEGVGERAKESQPRFIGHWLESVATCWQSGQRHLVESLLASDAPEPWTMKKRWWHQLAVWRPCEREKGRMEGIKEATR